MNENKLNKIEKLIQKEKIDEAQNECKTWGNNYKINLQEMIKNKVI